MQNDKQLNIPNLFNNNINSIAGGINDKSVLDKAQEQTQKKIKNKIRALYAISIVCLTTAGGMFAYQSESNNVKNHQNNALSTFYIQNQTSFPIINSQYESIKKISLINKEIKDLELKNNELIQAFNNTINYLQRESTNGTLSASDQIRFLQIKNMQKIFMANQLTEIDLQQLKMLGTIENNAIINDYNKIISSGQLITKNNKLNLDRKNLLNQLSDQLMQSTQQNSNTYYWFALFFIIASLATFGLGGSIYIKNERNLINEESLKITTERLDVISTINNIAEMNVNNLTNLPMSSNFIGGLIDVLNQLFKNINRHNYKLNKLNDAIIQKINNNDFAIIDIDKQEILNYSTEIQLLLTQLVKNLQSLQIEQQRNDIQDIIKQINNIKDIEFNNQNNFNIQLEELNNLVNGVIDVDNQMSTIVNNLEIYSQNVQSNYDIDLNSMDSLLAFKTMKERLPQLMNDKIQMNKILSNFIKNNLTNQEKQVQYDNKQLTQFKTTLHNIKNILLNMETQESNTSNIELQSAIEQIKTQLRHINVYIQSLHDLIDKQNNSVKDIIEIVDNKIENDNTLTK